MRWWESQPAKIFFCLAQCFFFFLQVYHKITWELFLSVACRYEFFQTFQTPWSYLRFSHLFALLGTREENRPLSSSEIVAVCRQMCSFVDPLWACRRNNVHFFFPCASSAPVLARMLVVQRRWIFSMPTRNKRRTLREIPHTGLGRQPRNKCTYTVVL